jgi:hypothetical protein
MGSASQLTFDLASWQQSPVSTWADWTPSPGYHELLLSYVGSRMGSCKNFRLTTPTGERVFKALVFGSSADFPLLALNFKQLELSLPQATSLLFRLIHS